MLTTPRPDSIWFVISCKKTPNILLLTSCIQASNSICITRFLPDQPKNSNTSDKPNSLFQIDISNCSLLVEINLSSSLLNWRSIDDLPEPHSPWIPTVIGFNVLLCTIIRANAWTIGLKPSLTWLFFLTLVLWITFFIYIFRAFELTTGFSKTVQYLISFSIMGIISIIGITKNEDLSST